MILYNGDIFEFVLWDIVEKMRYFWCCILRYQWCNEMFMMLDLEISVISFWRDDGDIIAEIAGVLFFIFKIFFCFLISHSARNVMPAAKMHIIFFKRYFGFFLKLFSMPDRSWRVPQKWDNIWEAVLLIYELFNT